VDGCPRGPSLALALPSLRAGCSGDEWFAVQAKCPGAAEWTTVEDRAVEAAVIAA
jgi:hypothetical protein